MSNDTNMSDNKPTQDDARDEPPTISGDVLLVTFSSSGIQVPWLGNHESLLELAEANGLSPDFSCRAGVCNTCECSISSGDVSYLDEPLSMPEDGRALICCSIPDGDITLDL
jgi:ferredoxin